MVIGNLSCEYHFLCMGLGVRHGIPGESSMILEFPFDRIGKKGLFVILKGPSLLVANFGLTTFLLRFWASSHTLSPMMKGVNLDWI